MNKKIKTQYLLFILLGTLVLILKPLYKGPLSGVVISQGSNFSVSFAVYFIAQLAFQGSSQPKLWALIGSALAVQLFELTNGFGMMTNVYDPWDYLANALGIGLAFGIDCLLVQTRLPGPSENNQ